MLSDCDRGVGQGDLAGVAARVGADVPARALAQVDRLGLRDEDALRREPFADRRRQGEGLEGRARLAASVDGHVELLGGEAASADQRLDLVGVRVDGDDRDGRIAGPVEDRRRGRVGVALHARVQRRVDPQAAAEGGGRPELVHELLDHVLHEVGRETAGGEAVRMPRQRRARRCRGIRRRDHPLSGHGVEHGLRAGPGRPLGAAKGS